MLSISDYNHLKLLYDQFLKMNTHIKELITNNDWESVDFAIQDKDALLRKIIFFEKPRIELIKANSELHNIRLNLIELEKQNIELVKSMKEKLFNEIKTVKKTKKVLNAYEPSSNLSASTFEINDIE